MKADFIYGGHFQAYNELTGEIVEGFKTLQQAVDYVVDYWDTDGEIRVCIVDCDTGEILVQFSQDDEDEVPDYDDDMIECGFNPYLGTFDWDC